MGLIWSTLLNNWQLLVIVTGINIVVVTAISTLMFRGESQDYEAVIFKLQRRLNELNRELKATQDELRRERMTEEEKVAEERRKELERDAHEKRLMERSKRKQSYALAKLAKTPTVRFRSDAARESFEALKATADSSLMTSLYECVEAWTRLLQQYRSNYPKRWRHLPEETIDRLCGLAEDAANTGFDGCAYNHARYLICVYMDGGEALMNKKLRKKLGRRPNWSDFYYRPEQAEQAAA